MNPWKYKGKVFRSEQIEDNEGFVYCITNLLTNRRYIGRKYFWELRKAPGSKRRTRKESNWQKYHGSCLPLLNDVQKYGPENFRREILGLYKHRPLVNYFEIKEQFIREVLETDEYYNENINGKWHWVKAHTDKLEK